MRSQTPHAQICKNENDTCSSSHLPKLPPPQPHLLKSTLALALSRLGRTEELELRRLLARCSDGSDGRSPLDLANKFRMSVMDTTPVRQPDRRAPGRPLGRTAVEKVWFGSGDGGAGALAAGGGMITVLGGGLLRPAGWLACSSGVAGALGEGEADSTTHMRWDFVATSLATVWPRVE